jgi:putative colanic acid biosynthesis UDP-glucose lipid carrier transferase
MIENNIGLGYNFLGFVDDEVNKNKKIIGKIDDLDLILQNTAIDEVVIALPFYASNLLDNILRICNRHAVRINIIPDYIRFLSKKFRINMIGNLPIISVRDEPLAEAHWKFIKRSFDIIISIIVSVLILWWLFPLIAIIIKFNSPGPIFFIQERVGVKNELFKCYKFRTMKKESDKEKFQPVIEDDPRITKFGNLLRRSNLDELPQIINVLKGEMSLVGPRPHTIVFNNLYKEMVNELKLRSWVKPGITGWAQIHGYRGDVTDFKENKKRTQKRIDYDIWYIENWTFGLDIQIILLTIWQMIKADTKGV